MESPTQSRTYNTLVPTKSKSFDRLVLPTESIALLLDQHFVGLTITKIGLVELSTQNVRLMIHSVGLLVCRTIVRSNIENNPIYYKSASKVLLCVNHLIIT